MTTRLPSKLFAAALLLGAAPAFAQGVVPTLKPSEGGSGSKTGDASAFSINGVSLPTILPGASASVEGSGVPGLDGGRWYLSNHPSGWDANPTFRSDRIISTGSAPTAGQPNSWPWANVVVHNQTNFSNIGFETGVLSWFDASAGASTGAQQVSGEFVITKNLWRPTFVTTGVSGDGTTATITYNGSTALPVGHHAFVSGMTPTGFNGFHTITASSCVSGVCSVSFASSLTGPQTVAGVVGDGSTSGVWAFNANATDYTDEPDPIAPLIGAEIDVQAVASTTDAHRQRVGVQIEGATTHVGRGVLFGTKGGGVFDRAVEFGGTYQYGLDFAAGTFSGPVALLAPNQNIAFDANTSGAFNRYLGYNSTALALQYWVNGNVGWSVSDTGQTTANAYNSNAGQALWLTASAGQIVKIGLNGVTDVYEMGTAGFYPTNASIRALGSPTYGWSTVYAANVGAVGNPVSLVTATTINASGTITGNYVAAGGGFIVNGNSGFTGTKVAGACTFYINGGIITNATGC